jgi:hypothetical protein
MTTNKHDRKEGRSANIGFAKWRVQCFYDSLVQGSSSVFQMKFCAENPPLRKAENRQAVKKLRFSLNYIKIYRCIIQYRHPKQACFLSSNF